MSICFPAKFKVRILIPLLILSISLVFDMGSTLAAQNRGLATPTAQSGNSQLTGQLIANGPVTVNGNKAITGTTVFNGSNIVVDCASGNSAIVNLGRLGRIELVAGTKLTLRFSDGMISGDLQDGKAVISTPPGVKVAVNTPDGVASAGGDVAAVTPVVAQRGVRCIPAVVTSSGPNSTLSNGALTAAALGVAGGAAAGIVIATKEDEASPTRP